MKQFNRDKLRNKLEQRNQELKEVSETALSLLQEEAPVQDDVYNKKIALCKAFVEKLEDKTVSESSVEKLILINCYMSLGKHHINFYEQEPLFNYTKAQCYFLQACNRSFTVLQSGSTDIIFLDNAAAFGKISIYLAYYYDNKENACFHYKRICDVVTSAFEYAIKWKKAGHAFELAAILAIAYQGLKDFDYAIKYFDYIKKMDNEQQDYSNVLRLEFMLAMLCASKFLNRQRQYRKAVDYCKIILRLSETMPEHSMNPKAADIVNNRIKFECLLTLTIANIGLADLCASKFSYRAALTAHIFIYQHNLASEVYKKNYPLIAMTEKLEKAISYLDDIAAYLNTKNIKLTMQNSEQVFKGFLYERIPHLAQETLDQLNFEVLKDLADRLSDYMTLITAWPISKKFKIELIQKAANVNRQINNTVKVRCFEAMLAELHREEAKPEDDIIGLISSIKINHPITKKITAKKDVKKSAGLITKKLNISKPAVLTPEDMQQNYYQTILLTAYRLYKEKKFNKAIKLYTKLKQQNLNSKLIAMQCLSGIGENFSAWADDLEQHGQKSTIATYRKNALQAYLEAVQLLPADISDNQEQNFIEMQRLAEFIYPLINTLQTAGVKAAEEEIGVTAKKENYADESRQTTLQKIQANPSYNVGNKPQPLTLANCLSPSLEKVLQRSEKKQMPVITISKPLEMSAAAKEVECILKEAGFQVYLVGGAVRDQILGLQPKDYDIVTNAKPEQIAALFPGKSAIVGNRFMLVLIKINNETVDVVTLRQDNPLQNTSSDQGETVLDKSHETLLRQDVQYRDFTFNGLYYQNKIIIDLVGGYEDLKNRLIRTIRKAKKCFLADPVNMLRALRFAATFDFTLHEDIIANLPIQAVLLSSVNLDRLYREIQHTFLQRVGAKVFALAFQHQVLQVLFPATSKILAENERERAKMQAILSEIDSCYRQNKQVSTAIFLAIMLWLPLQAAIPKQGVANSITSILNNQLKIFHIPAAVVNKIKAIWLIQLGNYHSVKINIELALENEDFSRANVFADLLKKAEYCENNSSTASGIKLA